MLRLRFLGISIYLWIFLMMGGVAATAAENQPDSMTGDVGRGQTIVIGRVSKDPGKHYKKLKPIADYVAERMGDIGIRQAKVLFARDNAEMIRYLREGKVDWVTESPFSALAFVEKAGAEILLRRWKKGVSEYHTVFFARKDSHIHTLQDLAGKTIAFEDPGSTSAFLLPAAALIQEGLTLVALDTPRKRPPAGRVGYVFANSEINAPTWVFRGLVDAGAFSNLDWDDSDRMLTSMKEDIDIIYRTRPIPRTLELVRKGIDPEIKKRLKEILLNAHADPDAQQALRAYKKTTRFDALDEKTARGMEWIRSLSDILDTHIL